MKTEFDYYITPDGETFNLNDWGGTWLLSGDGFGMPPMEFKTTRGPFQHGETPIDFFLLPRTIQYQFRLSECNRERYYQFRNTVLNYLRPSRQWVNTFEAGVLRKILKDGTQRDIKVMVGSGPTFGFRNDAWDEWGSTNTLRFIAHDPVFYDPTLNNVPVSMGISTSNLVFPITFPITFGDTVAYVTQNIVYLGTWISYPTIIIVGPFGNPTIINESIDEKIELNYFIPAGRTVTINLEYGHKTITDNAGNNLIGTLTYDSDLATFHLAPYPEAYEPLLTRGTNSIRVIGSGLSPVSAMYIRYYTRYIGI